LAPQDSCPSFRGDLNETASNLLQEALQIGRLAWRAEGSAGTMGWVTGAWGAGGKTDPKDKNHRCGSRQLKTHVQNCSCVWEELLCDCSAGPELTVTCGPQHVSTGLIKSPQDLGLVERSSK
jgi:hypothetical protein